MNIRDILVAALVAVAGLPLARAQHLASLKVGSQVYSNVTVTALTATDIYFSHSQGLGNAKLKSLEPELQARFHFDASKAARFEEDQRGANALYTEALHAAKPAAPPKSAPGNENFAPAPEDGVVPSHEVLAKSFLNQPAPEIIAEKFLDSAPDAAGKFVMLEFWATWSEPCRRSIPLLNEFYNQFKDKLIIIGLTDENEAQVRRMAEPRIDYSIAVDPRQRALRLFSVQRIPHAVLIDPKGIVRFEGHPGYLDAPKLSALIAKYAD